MHFSSPANGCYGNQENVVSMVTMSTVARGIFIYSIRHTTSHMACTVKILGDFNKNWPRYIPYKMPITHLMVEHH